MGTLRKVALVILAISFVTFVALFGRLPALRNTPIGYLNRAIFIHSPKALYATDRILFKGRMGASLARLGVYLMNEKHPLVMIFFLGLVTASAALFLSSAWGKLPLRHQLFIPVILPTPYLFTWLCARSNASQITSSNLAENLALYPYDHVIYHSGRVCRTCNLLKPARSKHCSICRACVSRLDHHCVWVNNCLGRDNYRWFLALVASLGVLLMYGAFLAYSLLSPLLPPKKRQRGMLGFFDRWGMTISKEPSIGAVGLLALTTAPLASGLFIYHVYLIWAGTTTNETAKWSELGEDMADGLVWRGQETTTDRGLDLDKTTEPNTSWPVSSTQIIIKTPNGKPPGVDASEDLDDDEHVQWKRCWRLAEVDNIYDLGFWDNLTEVLTVY